MRLVVDTNVFISALTFRDTAPRAVLRLCLAGHVIPLIGNALYCEYEDVLRRPEVFLTTPVPEDVREDIFRAFLRATEWTTIYYAWRPNLRDEADNHLIELALAGQADWIVTHNLRDLTSGEMRFDHLRIGTPAQFMRAWRML